jgi:hypothetical protein
MDGEYWDTTNLAYFGSGQVADRLCTLFGWINVNANKLGNPGFEINSENASIAVTTGLEYWTASTCTLAHDATHVHSGSWAMKVTPVSGTPFFYPIGYHNNGGTGNGGAYRFGMQPNLTYTFSAWLYIPTGTGRPSLNLNDTVGGVATTTTTQAAATFDAWQRVSVTRTIRASATDAYLNISTTDNTPAHVFWVDDVQLECNSAATTYADRITRGAINGTTLSNATSRQNALEATLATRYTPFAPLDVVMLAYGTNDQANAIGITADQFRASLRNVVGTIVAASPNALLIFCSMGNLSAIGTVYWPLVDIIRQGAREAGGVFVDITPSAAGNLVDGTHPNVAGNIAVYNTIKAMFGK